MAHDKLPKPKFLFVYGTLMPCAGQDIHKKASNLGFGYSWGSMENDNLRMFDCGYFPYVIEDDSEPGICIWGEVLTGMSEDFWRMVRERESMYELSYLDVWIPKTKMHIRCAYWKAPSIAHTYVKTLREIRSGSWRNIAIVKCRSQY